MFNDLIGNVVMVRGYDHLMPGGLATIQGVSPDGNRLLVKIDGGLRDISKNEILNVPAIPIND